MVALIQDQRAILVISKIILFIFHHIIVRLLSAHVILITIPNFGFLVHLVIPPTIIAMIQVDIVHTVQRHAILAGQIMNK